MVLRVLQALAGALLAAGGGYFAWINRGSVDGMFPPEPGLSVWTFIAGLVATIIGAVAIVHAIGPRPKAKAQREAAEQRRAEILRQAEQFYSAQAEGFSDAGVKDGDPLFPEGLRPAGTPRQPHDPGARTQAGPRPPGAPPPEPFRLHSLSQPPPASRPAAPPVSSGQSEAAEPAPASVESVAQPVSQPAPAPQDRPALNGQVDAGPHAPARPFPAQIASKAIPRAEEAPPPLSFIRKAEPAPKPAAPEAAPAAATQTNHEEKRSLQAEAPRNSRLDEIRAAIEQNRLEDADRLLATTRKQMNEHGGSNPIELAQLTGLAGDHAAADGRLGSAKWLWRLALQRFAAAGAIDDPAARAVSERMRLADQ